MNRQRTDLSGRVHMRRSGVNGWMLALVLAALSAVTVPVAAQGRVATVEVSDTLYDIRLSDGSSYVGRIVIAEGDSITLQSVAGVRVQFHRAQIAAIELARGRIVDGSFWREDSNRTRLFFGPTARTLSAGEGYGGLFFILPFVAYGLTDAVTLSGGLPLIGGSDGAIPFFYLAPKVRMYSTPSMDLGAGVFAAFDGTNTAGIAYGVGTFGDTDNAVTAGAGVPFASGPGFADEVVVMVGGETRVGRRMKLLTENWFVPGVSGALITGGFRLLGERWTTDLGLAAVTDGGSYFYFPIVSFAYAFGGGR
jgi:hypothetical protein